MDWVAIGAIAAIVSALAAAVSAWVAYREYQDKKNTGQPRSPKRSVPPLSVDTSYRQSEHRDIDEKRRSQPQLRQVGILSSKKARRSVLLGSTALGLVLIFYSIGKGVEGILPFNLGVSIILLGSVYVCVWRVRTQGIASWRGAVLFIGGVAGVVICVLAWNNSMLFLVLGFIICFISIYIGGW